MDSIAPAARTAALNPRFGLELARAAGNAGTAGTMLHELSRPDSKHQTGAGRRDLPAETPQTEFAFIDSIAGFEALAGEWDDLFERAGTSQQIFQAFDWNWHWCKTFLEPEESANTRLAVVTARRAGRLVLVVPCVSARQFGVTQLRWMGEPVSQYGDVLIDDIDDANAVIAAGLHLAMRESGAILAGLRKVRADSRVAPVLHDMGSNVTERLIAPAAKLDGVRDLEEFSQRYKQRSRKNRKSRRRRLESMGTIDRQLFSSGPAAEAAAREAISLKRKWLREKGLVSRAFSDARLEDFFALAVGGGGRRPSCHVSSLSCGGETAAATLSLVAKGRVAVHICVYDARFEKQSAGTLLIDETIGHAIASGQSRYDLLAPGDDYKFEFCDESVEVCDHTVARDWRGKLYSQAVQNLLRGTVKRALAKLPQHVRRRLTSVLAILLAI